MAVAAPPDLKTTWYAEEVVAGRVLAGPLVRLACARHLRDLDDGGTRGLHFDDGRAAHIVEFFPRFLRLTEGAHAQQPFVLEPWQQFIVGSLFGWLGRDGYRRFRKAYIETPKGPLALDTPVPTPTGWTTMGELRPGDQVFGDQGQPCAVLAVSPVFTARPCYRVVFDDGEEIVADAEHRWLTERRRSDAPRDDRGGATRGVPLKERGRWRVGVRTTQEIRASLRYLNGSYQSANHSVALAGALALSEVDVPVHPYVLGVWLGDGDSDSARITVGDEDTVLLDHLRACGVGVGKRTGGKERAGRYLIGSVDYSTTCHRGHPRPSGAQCRACERLRDHAARHGEAPAPRTRLTLREQLRALDVLANKHIPLSYLRASSAQRLALLQGLMDTDGYINRDSGECEFTNCRREVAAGVLELVRSLGMKAAMNEGRAMIHGRDVGEKYRVYFHPPPDLAPFRLTRKAARHFKRHNRRRLSGERRIVDVFPTHSVPVRCITVDAPSQLFLAGRGMIPTHNSGKTPLASGIGLYGLIADGEAGAEIYTAATMREQAAIAFRDAKHMVESSPDLRSRIEINVGNLAYLPAKSFLRPVSSEARGLDGKRVHMALIDELHEHPTDVVVEKMQAGTKGRRQPLICEITNAGYDRHSVCWTHHDYSAKVLHGVIEDDGWFAYVGGLDPCVACRADGHEQPQEGCAACDDWRDEAVWEKANPNLGISVTKTYLREQVREAEGMPSKANIVKRLNFCIDVYDQNYPCYCYPCR